jgi:hypothetical protein
MNHIAGVEVVESLGDVGYLVVGISVGQTRQEGHLRVEGVPHWGAS